MSQANAEAVAELDQPIGQKGKRPKGEGGRFVEGGRIVEIGTHDELAAAGGRYAHQLAAGELIAAD